MYLARVWYRLKESIFRHPLCESKWDADEEKSARKVCIKLAEGNIPLQSGRYQTTKQYIDRREKNLIHRFSTFAKR